MQNARPTITGFKHAPDRGRAMARDFRVRWAFEEVGVPYDVHLMTFEDLKDPHYHELQPFGQIPTYQEGDLVLFESGAIVLYIAEKHPGLLPRDVNARARTISWLFSAFSTVELPIVEREAFVMLESEKPWFQERLPILDERVHNRLRPLEARLSRQTWLEDEFSAADIVMITVLRRLLRSGLLDRYQNVSAYISRGEARPAYQRAFAAQLEIFHAVTAEKNKV